MDEHKIKGSAKEIGGKVEETVGRATGSAKMEARGMLHQAEGKAEKTFGEARDTVSSVASAAGEHASRAAYVGRSTIADYPVTSVVVTFTVGLFVGGMMFGGK
jgi:uncharacterized protein YjbJ (UPF0337 family)